MKQKRQSPLTNWLMVGCNHPVSMALIVAIASRPPAAPRQCPIIDWEENTYVSPTYLQLYQVFITSEKVTRITYTMLTSTLVTINNSVGKRKWQVTWSQLPDGLTGLMWQLINIKPWHQNFQARMLRLATNLAFTIISEWKLILILNMLLTCQEPLTNEDHLTPYIYVVYQWILVSTLPL